MEIIYGRKPAFNESKLFSSWWSMSVVSIDNSNPREYWCLAHKVQVVSCDMWWGGVGSFLLWKMLNIMLVQVAHTYEWEEVGFVGFDDVVLPCFFHSPAISHYHITRPFSPPIQARHVYSNEHNELSAEFESREIANLSFARMMKMLWALLKN